MTWADLVVLKMSLAAETSSRSPALSLSVRPPGVGPIQSDRSAVDGGWRPIAVGGLHHRRHRDLHRHRDHLQHRHRHATAAHSGASGMSSAYGNDADDNDSDDLQVG